MARDSENGVEDESSVSVIFHKFEQALQVVGPFNRSQISFLVLLQFMIILWCGNIVFMAYGTYAPTVTCYYNDTNHRRVLLHYNKMDHKIFCEKLRKNQCSKVIWNSPFYTLIQEWYLICERDHIPQTINSIQMLGTLSAAFISGQLSDYAGRKLVFCWGMAVFLLVGVLDIFAPNWILFAICRFFIGATVYTTHVCLVVWGMEMTDKKHNMLVNICSHWHVSYIVVAALGYYLPYWKTYLLALNLSGIPIFLLYLYFFVESPRWLIQKGRLIQAAKQLTWMASQNRFKDSVKISSDNLVNISVEGEETRRAFKVKMMFSERNLTVYTLVLMLTCAATASVSQGYIFQVGQFEGSPFRKFFYFGLFRLWIPVAIYLLNKRDSFGRKQLLILPMCVVFLCHATITLNISVLKGSSTLTFVLALTAAVTTAFLWTGLFQIQAELYPTMLRNTATATIHMVDPVMGVLMPQLVYFEKFWPSLPFFIISILCLVAIVLDCLFIPETKGRPLPDTLEDLHEFQRNLDRRIGKKLLHVVPEEELDLLQNIDIEMHVE